MVDDVSDIATLITLDYPALFVSVFIILFAIKAMVTIFEWIIEKFGLETRNMKNKREDHELLIKTSQSLLELKERHETDMKESEIHDTELRDELKKLNSRFLEKEINDIRWEINNFANKISEGKVCNKDSYRHCLQTYEHYEQLLRENGLENGEIEMSMQIIKESYKGKLKEGF